MSRIDVTFAYGWNLDPESMRGAEPLCRAVLRDHRLTFRPFACAEPCPGASVQGALWRLPAEVERALDRREGYPHLYGKEQVEVEVKSGPPRLARGYVPHDALAYEESAPYASYLEVVRRGYRYWGLDESRLPKEEEE